MSNDNENEANLENALNQSTMLLAYFNLNTQDINARNYNYSEIPTFYTFDSKKKHGICENEICMLLVECIT